MVRERRLRDRHRSRTWCASRRAPDGGKRYVLLDAAGPGAIVRIWTATPAGTLRIYIDGDRARPALEAPIAALLRGDGGAVRGAARARHRARLQPLLPVPVRAPLPGHRRQHRLARPVHAAGRWRSSTTRSATGVIAPRRPRDVRPYSAARAGARRRRRSGASRPCCATGRRRAARARAGGPSAIAATDRRARPPLGDDDRRAAGRRRAHASCASPRAERTPREAARRRALTIAFDGETTVDAPLIDFFGTGPAWNTYSSLPLTVAPRRTC